jgi:hypothetical protein
LPKEYNTRSGGGGQKSIASVTGSLVSGAVNLDSTEDGSILLIANEGYHVETVTDYAGVFASGSLTGHVASTMNGAGDLGQTHASGGRGKKDTVWIVNADRLCKTDAGALRRAIVRVKRTASLQHAIGQP